MWDRRGGVPVLRRRLSDCEKGISGLLLRNWQTPPLLTKPKPRSGNYAAIFRR